MIILTMCCRKIKKKGESHYAGCWCEFACLLFDYWVMIFLGKHSTLQAKWREGSADKRPEERTDEIQDVQNILCQNCWRTEDHEQQRGEHCRFYEENQERSQNANWFPWKVWDIDHINLSAWSDFTWSGDARSDEILLGMEVSGGEVGEERR